MKNMRRFLCMMLAAALFCAGFSLPAFAAIDGCKVIDVSLENVFVENAANTLDITVGSLYYDGGFGIAVYDGGMERQKIYEGSGTVSGYDWGGGTYGQTVISVPITARPCGIVQYEIYLTPEGGSAVKSTVVFRVLGANEVMSGLLISDNANGYTHLRDMLKQKGVNVTVATTPNAEQISNSDLIIIGTNELNHLPDRALGNKNVLLFKNGGLSDKANAFLSTSGSTLSYGRDLGEVRTQEYGNCIHYKIVSTDLDKDTPIKNRFFHINNASAVTANGGNAETVAADVLLVDLLPSECKLAAAGGDFLSDSELAFAADDMYAQLFSSESYDPLDTRVTSNYNLTSNLLDWMLPQPNYQDADIQTVKNSANMPGSFVSVTGTVVTPSESITQNGTAFKNYIYLQDETGGIRVYGVNRDVTYAYAGWELNIKGFVSSYGGEREIVVADQFKDIALVSRKDHAVESCDIAASQVDDNNLVGTLVRISGTVSGLSAGSLSIKDDSGGVDVFVDSYMGSSRGNWAAGSYDPRIEYGCIVEVTGILSKQDGKTVIRVRDTAEIVLKYDKDGSAVEPSASRSNVKFGGGLVEVTQESGTTVTIGEEKKELTEYMKLMTDLGIISGSAIPDKDLPIGNAFAKMLEGCKLYPKQQYDNSVRGAALQVLSALGYDYFFTGDNKAANETMFISQTEILEGITADQKSALTTKDAARMIYNALEISMFGQKYYTNGGGDVYQELDECLLDKLNLTKVTGVINETHFTKTSGNLPLKTVRMSYTTDGISGEDLFYSDSSDVLDLVGYRIEAFVLDDNDNDRNIVGVLREDHNTVYRLPNEDYVGLSGTSIKHRDENGREESLPVSADAKLYINGVFSGAVSGESMAKPFEWLNTLAHVYGWYNFIDNNKDGEVDYVLVDVYRDIIISSMDKQTFRVDDKISDVPLSLFLDPDYDKDYRVTYAKSTGEAASFADAEKGDVLSIRIARQDGKNIVWAHVVITKGSIKGKITGLNAGDMQLEINGDGKWYDYIEIDDLRQEDFLFNLGDDGRFFVNMKGVVIMKDLKSMPYMNYAFVIAYGIVDANLDEIPAMAVYLPTGGWTSYYFAQNVTVRDGGFSETLKREELVNRYLKDDATGELSKNTRTLVNFELSDQGEIKTISFPFNNATGKNDKGRLTIDRKYNQPDGANIPELNETFTYDEKLKNIGDAFLTDNTIIFDVTLNGDETLENVDSVQDQINIIPVSKLRDGSAPIISLFDMGDGNECAAAVTINAARRGSAPDNLFIVSGTKQVSIDGDTYTKLFGWEKGEAKEMLLSDDVEITDFMSGRSDTLGSGDLILYNQNAFGQVSEIRIVLNVAMAKGYVPDIYSDGSLLLPKVNFYSDTSNSKQVVQYYYGLATEKYTTKPYGKLVLARDSAPYPTTLLDKLQSTAMVVTSKDTHFYRVNQSNPHNPVLESSLSDCVVATSGSYAVRNGDLAVVKTVNNIATDVIFISPPNMY